MSLVARPVRDQSPLQRAGFRLSFCEWRKGSGTPLSHQEVLEAGRDAEPVISDLLARVIGVL